MLRRSALSTQLIRPIQSRYPCRPPIFHLSYRTESTIAEEIVKPVSEAPESIQEETIKGTSNPTP